MKCLGCGTEITQFAVYYGAFYNTNDGKLGMYFTVKCPKCDYSHEIIATDVFVRTRGLIG